MGRYWTMITYLHSLAGPSLSLLYPLYASVVAIESPTKIDDEQWLAYWILYSFITLMEMLLHPLLEWIPIWYEAKLIIMAWLVLPQFKGAAFLYDKFVRQQIKNHRDGPGPGPVPGPVQSSPSKSATSGRSKKKFIDFIKPKKGEHEAY